MKLTEKQLRKLVREELAEYDGGAYDQGTLPFRPGDEVKVISGPYAGDTGTVMYPGAEESDVDLGGTGKVELDNEDIMLMEQRETIPEEVEQFVSLLSDLTLDDIDSVQLLLKSGGEKLFEFYVPNPPSNLEISVEDIRRYAELEKVGLYNGEFYVSFWM